MDRFTLTDDLLTGVPDIDDQHRTLLALGNKVIDPSVIDKDGTIFRDALSFLAGYVLYHFAAEEHVMENAGYPRWEPHRQWHERFRAEIDGLIVSARKKGVSRALKLKISFAVENWLVEHIRITDRDLAEFLRQHAGGKVIRVPDVRTLKPAGAIPQDFDERFAKTG
jgi:hemerythrin